MPPFSSQTDVVLALMARHRSIRAFEPAPVPDEHVEQAVRAAQCAATSSWIQSYHLIQVVDAQERQRLAALAGGQAQVHEAGAFFVVCGDTRRHELVAEDAKAARHVTDEVLLLAVIDASLFAQNLTLAFEAMDYGVCYIGGLRNDLDGVDEVLDLPRGVLPLFGLTVGLPRDPSAVRPRLEPGAVWSKGRYPSDEDVRAAVRRFDLQAAMHYEQRGLSGRDWSGGLWRKFSTALRPRVGPYLREKVGLEEPTRDQTPDGP